MNRRIAQLMATALLALTSMLAAVTTLADPESDQSDSLAQWNVQEDALGTPLGLVSSDDTRTVDGTGLRAISSPGTETVDGTGLMRMDSDPTIDTVDGTGLRNLGSSSTETVDGTGRLRSLSPGAGDSGQLLDGVEAEVNGGE